MPYAELYIDSGFTSRDEALAAGVDIGTPIVYRPQVLALSDSRIAGTSVDDRAGCAVIVEAARALLKQRKRPTVHFVFSVQEEFNLRGAVTAAQALQPDIAIQLDLLLATDTPDMGYRGDVRLGAGPAMSMYSFHGRGTLNGTSASGAGGCSTARPAPEMDLRRSARRRADRFSYVQLLVARRRLDRSRLSMRYSHSRWRLRLGDSTSDELLVEGIASIDAGFSLDRDDYE